jgi:UDP-N-acetylglucosamine 2-epimerase (non-hydrolysing)
VEILTEVAHKYAVVFPVHPRTRKNLSTFGLNDLLAASPNIHLIEPQGYVNFLALMMNARLVMTDSGGVQEETTALGVQCLTLRTTTERPITCEIGTNILVQPDPAEIRRALNATLQQPAKPASVPPLWDGYAADRIAEILVRILHL